MTEPRLDVLPLKASVASTMRRRRVYLDQNVVTGLAKIDLGRTLPAELAGALGHLREALRVAVIEKQSAVCVESFFHRSETSGLVTGPRIREGAEDLFHAISKFVTFFSFGLSLTHGLDLLEVQAALAVALDIGKVAPSPRWRWRAAFCRDPEESNDRRAIKLGDQLVVIGAEWVPAVLRESPWASRVTRMREAGEFPTFEAALKRIEDEHLNLAVRDNEFVSWADRWNVLDRIPRERMDEFINSGRLHALPLLYSSARLYAHVLSERTRRFSDSDPNDIDILSATIPYCDLVVTDSYMAAAVRSCGLGAAFNTTVLPASPAGLHQAADALLSWKAPPSDEGALEDEDSLDGP